MKLKKKKRKKQTTKEEEKALYSLGLGGMLKATWYGRHREEEERRAGPWSLPKTLGKRTPRRKPCHVTKKRGKLKKEGLYRNGGEETLVAGRYQQGGVGKEREKNTGTCDVGEG